MAILERDVKISDRLDTVEAKAGRAMACLGQVTASNPGEFVEGDIRCELQSVSLRVSWRGDASGALLLLQTDGGDKAGDAAREAMERYLEAFQNSSAPDYRPNRTGLHPRTILTLWVFALLAFFWLLSLLVPRQPLPTGIPEGIINARPSLQPQTSRKDPEPLFPEKLLR